MCLLSWAGGMGRVVGNKVDTIGLKTTSINIRQFPSNEGLGSSEDKRVNQQVIRGLPNLTVCLSHSQEQRACLLDDCKPVLVGVGSKNR